MSGTFWEKVSLLKGRSVHRLVRRFCNPRNWVWLGQVVGLRVKTILSNLIVFKKKVFTKLFKLFFQEMIKIYTISHIYRN